MTPPPVPWHELSPALLSHAELKAEGAGAAVYRAVISALPPHATPAVVAVRKPRIKSVVSLSRFEAELHLRSRISHPNLLPLLAACTSPPHYCTISPWMEGGTLFDALHLKSVKMSFQRLLQLSLQFANAVAYMHNCNLVHRDLKTANLLLDSTYQNLVVSDLDLAIDVRQLISSASRNGGRAVHRGPSNGRLSHMVGTLVYMAPEVLQGQPHSFAADVYAFAITVNEMATCAVPFVDRKLPMPELHTVLETRFNEVKLRGAIVKNHLRPVLANGVPEQFRQLLQQCWHPNPAERPTFAHIVASLEHLLAKGSSYLNQFTGTTIDTDEHLAATSKAMKIDDTNILLDEIKQHAANPNKPSWKLEQRMGSPTGFAEMAIDGVQSSLHISASLSSTCGGRGSDCMEDRSLVLKQAAGFSENHLFAVFDGHGGQACSEFAVTYLPGALYRAWVNENATPESALIHAFEDVDQAFLRETSDDEESGCTALAAFIVNSTLYVANAGDCRCVLASRDGSVVDLTKDHVATDPSERARIEARGGMVSITGRVQGSLMVSRAMGDRRLKRYVSATPEVTTTQISSHHDFIILASDGLWDVISSQEAVGLVRSTVRVPDLAAKRLAMKAIELGSEDNISVIVAFFGGEVSFSYLPN